MTILSTLTGGRSPEIDRQEALCAVLRLDNQPDNLNVAGVELFSENHERPQRIQAALGDLWHGYKLAVSLGRDVWDFAIEIDDLQKHGLRVNELRWLIFKGWIIHAPRDRFPVERSALLYGRRPRPV